jgi:NADH-quinone oxidoreductase subunit L
VDFATVFKAASEFYASTPEASWMVLGVSVPVMDTICLLLFMGAMGKSAQFLLHTWLPDAMEGPTPVSALIHAATMVTAGVFMLARCSPLFELAPTTLIIITYVGAITAFFAATIGLVQNDIKREDQKEHGMHGVFCSNHCQCRQHQNACENIEKDTGYIGDHKFCAISFLRCLSG